MRCFAPQKAASWNVFIVVRLFVAFTAALMVIKPTVTLTNGFITGGCSGGLTEMKWLFVIIIILLLGPLRRWVGRHWALLLSTMGGAVAGLMIGGYITAKCGSSYAWLPLVSALIGAAAAGRVGNYLSRS